MQKLAGFVDALSVCCLSFPLCDLHCLDCAKSDIIMGMLYKKLFSYICGRPVVFVCIGTDKIGGDCLGPLVGQLLLEADVPAFVYGNLISPVTALNVDSIGEFVRQKHPDCVVVAVDSAVGTPFEEGRIDISGGALLPGAADGKGLCPIGDVAVTAVTSAYAPSQQEFAAVRLGFVYALAQKIARLLTDCLCHSLYYTGESIATKNALTKD